MKVIDKKTSAQGTVSGKPCLTAKQRASIKVEYVHATGPASMHLMWSIEPGGERSGRIADRAVRLAGGVELTG